MRNNIARYMGLFDIHRGFEFNEENDYDKSVPRFVKSHDEDLLLKLQRFAKDWKPDYVIYGGDQVNLSCISRWTANKPRMVEGRTIKEDFDYFTEFAYPIGGGRAKKIWIEGNHEERLRDLINRWPQLIDLAETRKILHGLKIDHYAPSGKLYNLPDSKVWFTHGHIVLGGAFANYGHKLVTAYHRNVRAGHVHLLWMGTEKVAVDIDNYHSGITLPGLCRANLPYAKNKPSSNQQGFLIGEYDVTTGNFWDTPVLVINGEFIVNGKRY